MRVISRRPLIEFGSRHPDAREPLERWYRITKQATWRSLVDGRQEFPQADVVGRYTVFNIGGNKYRLVALVAYRLQRVFVLHIFTHEEYDRGTWKS